MIPNPRTTAGVLAVTDGHVTAGYVIEHDADQILIGGYSTQRVATRAIPTKENAEPTS